MAAVIANGASYTSEPVVLPIRKAKEPSAVYPAENFEYEQEHAKQMEEKSEDSVQTNNGGIRPINSFQPVTPR